MNDLDSGLHERIKALVEEEHQLRSHHENSDLDTESKRERLQAVEVELDRCWDLLRQRRALRESGQDPNQAAVRTGQQVEDYLG